jgi:hypothetical protein
MNLPRLCWHKYAFHLYLAPDTREQPWIVPASWVLESVCLRCGKKRR